jgi:hypothetical protein
VILINYKKENRALKQLQTCNIKKTRRIPAKRNRASIWSSSNPTSGYLSRAIEIKIFEVILPFPCSLLHYMDVKTTIMSIDRWIHKEVCVCVQWKTIQPLKMRKFCSKGQHGLATRILCYEIRQLQNTNTTWLHLFEVWDIVKFIELESKNGMVVAKD